MYDGDLRTALETFPERIMAVAIIDADECERVWIDEELSHESQLEWVAKHLCAASVTALKMNVNAGNA